MIKMEKMRDFETADFEGFTLQKGFYYGRNLRGQAIATSGWVSEGQVYLYTKTEEGWKALWTDIDLFDVDFEDYDDEVLSEPQQYAREMGCEIEELIVRK